MLRFLFGTPTPAPKVGMKWKINRRWSGQGIASESRKDGGYFEVIIEKVNDDGSVRLFGDYENVNWDGYFQKKLARPHVLSRSDPKAFYQQQCTGYPEYKGIVDIEDVELSERRGEYDEVKSEILRVGGLGAFAAYNKFTQ